MNDLRLSIANEPTAYDHGNKYEIKKMPVKLFEKK